MRTGFLKKFLTMLLVFALALPACAFAAPTEGAETDVFDNGLMRGSYYREGGTLRYNIDTLTDLGGDIYAALYDDDGSLVDAKVGEASGSFECPAGAGYEIKAYLWDENQSPLCEPLAMSVAAEKTEVVEGLVVANSVSDFNGLRSSDPELRNTVTVRIEKYSGSDGRYIPDSIYLFKSESDTAENYLGHRVAFNVPAEASGSIETIKCVMPLDAASTVTFGLDQYCYYDPSSAAIFYTKDGNEKTALPVDVNGVYVSYNGICGYDINDVFAPLGDADNDRYKVSAQSVYFGSVTVIDNNGTAGADFIDVALKDIAVVDNISPNGIVRFKNVVGSRAKDNNCNNISFNSDSHIRLTKNGQPFDYKQLKEWDLLYAEVNTLNSPGGNYVLEVKGDESIIHGVIEDTVPDSSYLGYKIVIDGKTYEVNDNVYSNRALRPSAGGDFYLDGIGRVAAFFQRNNTISYAYVLNGEIVYNFGMAVPVIQILYKDGTVAVAEFDRSVAVTNPTSAFDAENGDYTAYVYSDHDEAAIREALNSMIGQVVVLAVEGGYLKTLTLPKSDYDLSEFITLADAGDFRYNQYTGELEIGRISMEVADDAVVFFVGRPGDGYEYKKPAERFQSEQGQVDPAKGGVIKGSELLSLSGSGKQQAAAYASFGDYDSADAVVIYNSENIADPGVTPLPETELLPETAFISGIEAEGENIKVSYYQNGELKTALTAPGFSSQYLNITTQPGSLLKLELTDGAITAAEPRLTFRGEALPDILSGGENPGVPNIDRLADAGGNVIFGALVGKNGKRLFIAPMAEDNALPDFADVIVYAVKDENAECYVYDSAAAVSSRCGVGNIGDIYVNPDLAGYRGMSTDMTIVYGPFATLNPVAGMLDYIYISDDGRSAGMVLYKQRAYDYMIF